MFLDILYVLNMLYFFLCSSLNYKNYKNKTSQIIKGLKKTPTNQKDNQTTKDPKPREKGL